MFEVFVASEPLPAIDTADAIVRKFLPPGASAEDVAVARLWLFQQALIFIRNVEYLARPPLNLQVDEGFVERLTDRLGALTLSGLGGLATLSAQGRSAA